MPYLLPLIAKSSKLICNKVRFFTFYFFCLYVDLPPWFLFALFLCVDIPNLSFILAFFCGIGLEIKSKPWKLIACSNFILFFVSVDDDCYQFFHCLFPFVHEWLFVGVHMMISSSNFIYFSLRFCSCFHKYCCKPNMMKVICYML